MHWIRVRVRVWMLTLIDHDDVASRRAGEINIESAREAGPPKTEERRAPEDQL